MTSATGYSLCIAARIVAAISGLPKNAIFMIVLYPMAQPVVFDVETKLAFHDLEDRKPENLGISVVGTYSYESDEYRAYREEEFDQMFRLFERASVLIGYNSNGFDIHTLKPYYIGNVLDFPSLDLLESIKDFGGKRIALDEFAKETLGAQKTGHGLQAIEYYKEGKWEELISYCLADVKITKELYEYGKNNGVIYYKAPFGRRGVKVNWYDYVPKKNVMNLTLGI
jgi:DEAD/DEAH box helicase domain-containing protein